MPVITFLVVLGAAVIAVAVAGLVALPQNPVAFAMISTAIAASWLLLASQSFHRVRPGQRLAAFYVGTYDGVYVTGDDWQELQQRYAAAHREPDFNTYCRRGLHFIGLGDVLYLQYPFFDVRTVTTGVVRIPIEPADGVFTAVRQVVRFVKKTVREKKRSRQNPQGKIIGFDILERDEWLEPEPTQEVDPNFPPAPPASTRRATTPDPTTGEFEETVVTYSIERVSTPRVEMQIDVEVLLTLGVNIGRFFKKLPTATISDPQKLGEELKQVGVAPLVHDAIIEAVAGSDAPSNPFPGLTWEGPDDVSRNRALLEQRLVRLLREKTSILVEAGFLNPWDPVTGNAGPSAELFDIAVEEPVPRDKTLREKIGLAKQGQYEAEATRQREQGLTDALQQRTQQLGVKPDLVILQDIMKNTDATIVTVDTDALAGISRIAGLKGKKGGKPPR